MIIMTQTVNAIIKHRCAYPTSAPGRVRLLSYIVKLYPARAVKT